ncbi:hypothetical protein [Rhizobium sp. BR 249]|uniref:hypothetical protein n=1 Tax=Rhizobium sp. BR 249 TaxID=3040011 RepID=UPI0039BFBE80
MISKANAARLRKMFSENHEPAMVVGKKRYHPTLPVPFPTTKAPKGLIRARLPLMADGLTHLDTDPRVVAISPYPLAAHYWATGDPEKPEKREHVPHVAIEMRDQTVVFIDYIPLTRQKLEPWIARRTRDLKAHFREQFERDYIVLDERHLWVEPRFSNVKLMWQHKSRVGEPPSLITARAAVRAARLPATIDQIWRNAGSPRLGFRWEGEASAIELRQANPIFTAVMQLAMRGELRLDLGQPLSMSSVVRRIEHDDNGFRPF